MARSLEKRVDELENKVAELESKAPIQQKHTTNYIKQPILNPELLNGLERIISQSKSK